VKPEGKPEIISPIESAGGPGDSPPEGEGPGAYTLRVMPPDPSSPPPTGACNRIVSYAWQASGGQISGQGSVVTFTAPDHPDTVRIVVLLKQRDESTQTGATTIIVLKQWVILKADDLRFARADTVAPGWRRFVAFVEERKIRASLGLIGIEIERGSPDFTSLISCLAANPRFEIWNHGYDHVVDVQDRSGRTISEFRGTTYEHQLDHLLTTQTLARERCGVVLRAFGAPGNAEDSNTIRAINACDDIRVWFFGSSSSEKLVLRRTIEIEQPIFHPDEEGFITAYDPTPPCVTS
jgi:hypothetical protein